MHATLDGKKFDGIVLEGGHKSGDAETITFRGGRFHSSACDAYQYGEGAYEAISSGGAINFTAETHSPKYGKLLWQGVVRGRRLDGTLTMMDGGKVVGEKWVVAGEV